MSGWVKQKSEQFEISPILERLVDGKSVLIPTKLKENLPKLSRKKVGRDQIVIQWCWLDQMMNTRKGEKELPSGKKAEKKKKYLPIHNQLFRDQLPWNPTCRSEHTKKLIALQLLKTDGIWRREQPKKGMKGKALGYKIINRRKLVEHEFESGNYTGTAIIPKITASDPASKITRRNLGKLRLKKQLLAPAIHQTMLGRIEEKLDGWENFALKKGLPEEVKQEVDWEKNFHAVSGLLYPVMKINHNRGRIFRDNYGRLHSPFTNLKRVLRGIFEVENEELVGLDMRAAQPTLLALSTGDAALLKDCKTDKLYKKIMRECNVDRERAKKIWMAFAYGPIREERSPNKDALSCGKLARREWPITYKELHRQKQEKDYREVSYGMMDKESKLFIDNVFTGLNNNGMFALSVHDGLYVRKSDKKKALKDIQRRLGEGIALMFNVNEHPVIKVEETRPEWLTSDYDLEPEYWY